MVKAAVRVASKKYVALDGTAPSGLWIPKQDQTLLIELPGERLLANVARVVSPDTVICELINTPLMTKTHRYEKGEFVPCERTVTPFETVWKSYRPAPATKTRRKRNAA